MTEYQRNADTGDIQADNGGKSLNTPKTAMSGVSGSDSVLDACFIQVLKKSFQFSGRARRREFWYFMLFCIIGFAAAKGCDMQLQSSLITTLFWLFMFMPRLAVSVRRLHDVGRSGALAFANLAASAAMRITGSETFVSNYPSAGSITLIAILAVAITSILLFVFAIQDSQAGANRYGLNPKGI